MYKMLISSSEFDDAVSVILRVFYQVYATFWNDCFQIILTEGEMQNQDLQKKLTGTPKNNKFSKTIFGHLDRLLKEKQNISFIACEAFIMFVHIKTIDWYSENLIKKDMLLRKARSDVDSARKKFKVRLLEIESCRHADLQEKI